MSGVATICFNIGSVCKLYGSTRPPGPAGLFVSRLARAILGPLLGYSSNGSELVELPDILADLV